MARLVIPGSGTVSGGRLVIPGGPVVGGGGFGLRITGPTATSSAVVPYASTSVWNQSLSTLYPTEVPIHPDSSRMIASIQQDEDGTGYPSTLTGGSHTVLTSDPTQYSYPVYIVGTSTPVVRITLTGVLSYARDDANGLTRRLASKVFQNDAYNGGLGGHLELYIPRPEGAVHSPGGDNSIVFWNPTTGEEWGFWGYNPDGGGVGIPTAINGYRYRTDTAWADGTPVNGGGEHWTTVETELTTWANGSGTPGMYLRADGTRPGYDEADPANIGRLHDTQVWASRGAGTTFLIGLIRPWELEAGVINHAIAFAHDYPSPDFVAPASKSDGWGRREADVGVTDPYAPPEGARFRLKSTFDVNTLTGHARTIAVALRDYGMISIDRAGQPKVYPEAEETAGWGGTVTATTVAGIGLDQFEVVNTYETAPNPTAPTIGESTSGAGVTTVAAGLSETFTSTGTLTPASGDLLVALVTLKATSTRQVTGITGCGATWTRLVKTADGSNNLVQEVWTASAPASPTATTIAVTIVSDGADRGVTFHAMRSAGAQVHSNVTKTQNADGGITATPNATLATVPAGATVLGLLSHRLRNSSANNGTTILANTSAGASGSISKSTSFSRTAEGSVEVSATLSASDHWIMAAVALTATA